MKVGIVGAGSVGAATAFALMMRGVAKCRTETSTFRANVTATMAVCAYPSQFYDDKNFICCTWRDGINRMVVVYALADGE